MKLAQVLFIGMLSIPSVVFAQTEDLNLPELIEAAMVAAKGGKWSLLVSFVIMILVFFATKTKVLAAIVKPKHKPWIAAIAGAMSAVATNYVSTGDWFTAIGGGLTVGVGASGLWSLIGKQLTRASEPEKEE